MNKIIYLFLVVSLFLNAQNEDATLHFRDGGKSIKGLADVTKNGAIKFRLDKKSEPSIWVGDVLKGVTFHEFENDIDFEFVFTKNFKMHATLMKVLVFGEIKLFEKMDTFSYSYPISGTDFKGYNSYKKRTFFVQKASDSYATKLKGNFKKRIKEFFGDDCIGLQSRVKNHQFRWSTLPDLVEYYNNYCTDF